MGFYKNRIAPIAQALDKDKWKGFAIMYTVWLIDLATTAIALGFFGNELTEGNPAAASFFSLGIFGWLAWMCVAALVLMALIYLPSMFLHFSIWKHHGKILKTEMQKKKTLYNGLRLFNIVVMVVGEGLVILSNLNQLRLLI
jgi:hypothetical protein